MIKETVELNVKTGKAEVNVNDLAKSINKLSDNISEMGKDTKEGLKDIGDSAKETQKGVKGIGKAFKGVGTAMKAAGIGLVIGALGTLKEIFMENQKVADFFNTTFEVLSIAFNDLVSFFVNNISIVTDFYSSLFKNPVKTLREFGNTIKSALIDRFEQFVETLGFIGDGLKKLFEGDFSGAIEDFKTAGKESIDVLTGQDQSFEQVTTKIKEYTKSVVTSAKENVNLEKSSRLAAAAQTLLVEEYDRLNEQQRQIRDNDLLTIKERTAANDLLLQQLEAQKTSMLEEAELQLKSAEAQFAKNASIENEVALIEARSNKKGVEAQIEGFLSEQKSNAVALEKESLDLTISQAEAKGELHKTEREGTLALIDSEYEKLKVQKEIAEEEREIQTKLLKDKRNKYKEGTQAYQDANNELLLFQKQNANQQKEIDKNLSESKTAEVSKALGTIAGIVGENSKFGKGIAVVQAIQDTYAGATKAFAQGGVFGYIGAAGIIASGLANVKKITSSKAPKKPSFAKGGGTTGNVSIPVPTAPSFNIVGSSGTNQLAEAIGGQQAKPQRAYVVASDVSTVQELDRRVESSASI